MALGCKNLIEHSIWDESLLICNCACSLEYSSLSTLAGLSYHICGKLEVALKLHLHLSISTELMRPRRPKQYCLQLYNIYIDIFINNIFAFIRVNKVLLCLVTFLSVTNRILMHLFR